MPYYTGSGQRIAHVALDVTGTAADPATLVDTVYLNGVVQTSASWPVDDPATVVQDSTGNFHYDLIFSAAEVWKVVSVASGNGIAAVSEISFRVEDP